MNKLKRLLSIALGAVLSVFGALLFTAANVTAHAESLIDGADGKYEMSYDFGGQSGIGKQMLEKYFDKTAVVEKINDRYYFSFTQLSSSMENLSLNLESGKQIGYRVTERRILTRYRKKICKKNCRFPSLYPYGAKRFPSPSR